MAVQVTIRYGDEEGHQRAEQEVLTPLRRTTTSCVAMSSNRRRARTPHTVGTLADTTSLHVALAVVPIVLVLAAARFTLVVRLLTRANGGVSRPNLDRAPRMSSVSALGDHPKGILLRNC